MESCLKIAGSYIKRYYFPHMGITLLLCALSGGFMSFRNLDAAQCAKIMEMYVSLVGILLLTPLFMPEQDREIWDLEKSKLVPMQQLYLIRFLEAVCFMGAAVTGFVLYLQYKNAGIEMGGLWLGSFTETMFLGCIGFFVSACTNQVIIGYMLGFIYFAANMGAAQYFGPFALFQMSKGTYNFWPWMLAGSIVLTAGGILIRERQGT